MTPTLHTERLTLRPLTLDDLEYVVPFYASERSRYVGGPASSEQVWRMLAAEIGHWSLRGFGRWGVDVTATGATCGMVGLWQPEGWPEAEIGWDLWDGHEGKGYATEAGRAARDYAYDILGWATAISLVHPNNDGSRSVAKRLGAAYDGMFTHDRFGTLEIWRHPAPTGASNAA
jgi:RimJ/RimL family protein N-acetyltransferase